MTQIFAERSAEKRREGETRALSLKSIDAKDDEPGLIYRKPKRTP
jgi:hypothetical protein